MHYWDWTCTLCFNKKIAFIDARMLSILLYCLFVVSAEQMDEGLAGRQRQYEGLIHNLGKELNLCRAANQELSSKLREMRSPVNQAGDQSKGDKCL